MAFFQGGQGFLAGQGGSSGSVVVMTSQNILLAADQVAISSSAPFISAHLINTTGAAITLTSTPTVAPGKFDRQQLLLEVEVGSNGLVFQDASVLAGSGLRLAGAASKTIGARDSIWLTWFVSENAWLQTGNLVQV